MRINPFIMEKAAGETEYLAGRELDEGDRVRLIEEDGVTQKYRVTDTQAHFVALNRNLTVHCDCAAFADRGCCRHAVAVFLTAERNGVPELMLKRNAPTVAAYLDELVFQSMPAEPNLRLELTLVLPTCPGQGIRLGLRVGEQKFYVVRDICQFLEKLDGGEELAFGKGFVLQPDRMRFTQEDERLLDPFRRFFAARNNGETHDSGANARLIRLPEIYVEELMSMMKDTRFRIMNSAGEIVICHGIRETELPLRFEMNLMPRGLIVNAKINAELIPITENCTYVFLGKNVIAVPKHQAGLARLLYARQYDGKCLMEYPLKETERVIGELLPYLKLRGSVELSRSLRERLVRRNLKTEVYLDRDGDSIVARVLFRYGDITLNPFEPVNEKITLEKGEKLLLRDAEAEYEVLDILAGAGFRVTRENIRLSGQDNLFRFFRDDVARLQEICDIYPSIEFRKMSPRRPNLSGSIRMDGDQLKLTLEADGEPIGEVLELMEALTRKKDYFRLKNGAFLDLSGLDEWTEAAENVYEAALRDGNELNRDALVLRNYRMFYLKGMLENAGVRMSADDLPGSSEDTDTVPDIPAGMMLRDYQERGYRWLYGLDRLHMGGVLADDMGLGKTVQMIALLRATRAPGQTSLIVAPTSLLYNWLYELNRFAPELSAAVLSGTAIQRERLISHVSEHGDVDVLITSYPLIRRDIGLLKEIAFRFAVLDEAQSIKNAGSVAAVAVKQIRADTRFALTGTPMENGIGELWSIFDFVLPGYLPGYSTFLRRYQDGENAEDLRRRIQPFLMRRLKQDVLEELPEKMESTLIAGMTPGQREIYRAAMERLRPRVTTLLEQKGTPRARIEILSAITELRQICCHPGLILEDYRGGSGKEELLMQILSGLIAEGRRVLIFSQFTSMLKLLRSRMEEEGYSLMYLDGETPAGQRLEMTEEFNRGDTQIFLISLRAGGSGLNLVGADLVIHYDPWWNPAAEDQATDRAHRIGQRRKVQVIRLVTGESIEEQVVELGLRKKALFDRLITPGETDPGALSEQDIRDLFR